MDAGVEVRREIDVGVREVEDGVGSAHCLFDDGMVGWFRVGERRDCGLGGEFPAEGAEVSRRSRRGCGDILAQCRPWSMRPAGSKGFYV